MTEKEKRDIGILYDANNDVDLGKEMLACKDVCYEYNALKPSQTKLRTELIKKLFGKTSDNFNILAPFWCDYGYNIEIGDNFFANHNCVILDCAKVKFGNNVFVAPNCGFYTAGHPIDSKRRNMGLEYAYPITVGDNVWIGGGVHIMPGVTIGSNVVIGGGSVVTHDIPDNVIAVGNPCKVLREISEEEINKEYDFKKD
ncbi:MAG: sugar O-acetyltransferase [Clostridia bacterium]|nr:sugar O-acetyltransferase [Clostridia bacterium]MDE7329192.1 sugar O-acetyltransferase [Clostridia bacterium]